MNRYAQLPPPPITMTAVTAAGGFTSAWTAWFNAIWNFLNTLTTGAQGVSPGPADICLWVEGLPGAAEILLGFVMDRTVTFPSGWTNSLAVAKTAATASATFTIYQNSTSIGGITFGAGGSTGSFLGAGATFTPGQVVFIVGPSMQDATLANVSITLAGTRVN